MREELLRRLCALSPEEERLLSGAPLDQSAYSTGPAFLVQSEKMIPPGQAIALRRHTRFADFPMHRHDYVEILYMLSGQTTHTMEDGEEVTLRAGELLMINCHTAHGIRRCGQGDVAVNFIVLPAFFDFAIETIGADNLLGRFLIDALRSGEKEVPYLYFQVANIEAIQCVLESMVFSLLAREGGGALIHKTEMTLLFLHLLQNSEHMALSRLHRGNALVVSLLQAIHRDDPRLRFADFAAAHGVSAAYLSKTVRQATGQSCTALLQARRLKKAGDLLRHTDLSVLDICAAVGYSNSSHFYRIFERATGLSPTAYRQVNSGRG